MRLGDATVYGRQAIGTPRSSRRGLYFPENRKATVEDWPIAVPYATPQAIVVNTEQYCRIRVH